MTSWTAFGSCKNIFYLKIIHLNCWCTHMVFANDSIYLHCMNFEINAIFPHNKIPQLEQTQTGNRKKKHMRPNQIRLTVTVQIVYSVSRRIITLFIKCWVNWYGISHRIGGLCALSIHSTRSKAIILSKVSFLRCWIFNIRCKAENNITQMNEHTILHM